MKLGIMGTGMIVKDFLSASGQMKNVLLDSICGTERSKALIKELSDQYNISRTYTDYEDMLSDDIDTVYVAVPNNLHYSFSKKALEHGKNVIVEKPFTTNYREALELAETAKLKNLFIFEAITTLYLENYLEIKKRISDLGEIKIVECNFSQYSSRYDRFKNGEITPAFNPLTSGGALMDLNIYNIHYVTGLFGRPENAVYYPNIEKGIDTSGILIMDYKDFKCVCIGAKDCKAPIAINIQGNKGYISQDSPANVCLGFYKSMNDGSEEHINLNKNSHRMVSEFDFFAEIIERTDHKKCYELLEHSLNVSWIQTVARKGSGIIFPTDQENY